VLGENNHLTNLEKGFVATFVNVLKTFHE